MPTRQVTIQGIMTWQEAPGGGGEGGGVPTPPIFLPPGGVPTPPIYYPPVIGGGPGSLPPSVMPPIAYPPGIWGPPTMPPGFWGGGMGPGVPGQPGGGAPSHPIALPPGIWGPPTMPPGFWGGGMGPGVPGVPPQGEHLPVEPGGGPGGGSPIQGMPGVAGPGGAFVFYWAPGFGWVAVPAGGYGSNLPRPEHPIQPPQGSPPQAGHLPAR